MAQSSNLNLNSDTIAAISTSYGASGIAIIRMSGSQSLNIAQKILNRIDHENPGKLILTSLHDENKNILDKVLTVYFASPKSYTGEDMIEIHTHGGILIARICLELLIKFGARIAEPGEFTKRAFLNGHIDLSQAEGVLGIIQSKSIEAVKASARNLTGELTREINNIHEEILNLQGNIELELDFPEGEKLNFNLGAGLENIKSKLQNIYNRCSAGNLLNSGVKIVIAGKPNAGKSSLMNALLNKKRAIVTDIPGTTRDLIEENFNLNGIPVNLIDTAGIRESNNIIENAGIELAHEALRNCDLCLWVIDSTQDFKQDEINLIENISSDLKIIFVLNKSDLKRDANININININLNMHKKISVSAMTGDGINDLKNLMSEIITGSAVLNSGLNASELQILKIKSCLNLILQAEDAFKSEIGFDVIAGLLNSVRNNLLEILGIERDDELLNSIFSRFCVGK